MSATGIILYVRVLDKDWVVTDSLTVKGYYTSSKAKVERVVFADGTVWGASKMDAVRIRGSWRSDKLYGSSGRSDTFDSDAGSTDYLHGRSGDDVYWLGRGTGRDVVDEGYQNTGDGDTGDEIRLKAGIAPSSVRLERDGWENLYVRVFGADGVVTDSLRVRGHYASARARVERVVFADGTVWGAKEIWTRRVFGGGRGFCLVLPGRSDTFDSDVGRNVTLRGRSGDDVYWLGRGTGHDTIDEAYENTGDGDTGGRDSLEGGYCAVVGAPGARPG